MTTLAALQMWQARIAPPSKPAPVPATAEVKTCIYAKVAIIDETGRVLLLRRSKTHKSKAGRWDLPGGMVEIKRGEKPLPAARREAREEAGVRMGEIRAVGMVTNLETGHRGTSYCVGILAAGLILSDPAAIKLSSEHDAYVWAFPGMAELGDLQPKYRALVRQATAGIRHRYVSAR